MTAAPSIDPIKKPGAPVEFQRLDEIPAHESITMLLYGGSGTGKTVFVGSAGPRTLIINIGDGIITLQSAWAKAKFYREGMPIIATIREERDPATGMFKAADAFDKVKKSIEWGMDNFTDQFDTIAVDDATQLRAFAMNKGLEINEDFDRSKTLAKGKVAGGFVPAVQDFGAEMDLIEDFVATTISFCKEEKKHFILTAHERHIFKKVRDNTGRVIGDEIDKIRPGFTGKTFPDDITMYFDLVWNVESVRTGQGTIYRAYTEDAMVRKAKSRYPKVFQPVEVWPEFLKLRDQIKASGAKK